MPALLKNKNWIFEGTLAGFKYTGNGEIEMFADDGIAFQLCDFIPEKAEDLSDKNPEQKFNIKIRIEMTPVEE